MFIIDEKTNQIIDNPNLELGSLQTAVLNVFYKYVLDKPAEGEYVVVKEYPETGGKDVEWVESSPEVGHWEMIDAETNEVLPYPILLDTAGFPKDQLTPDSIQYQIYHTYTPEELEEIKKQKAEEEEQRKKEQERMEAINALPEQMKEVLSNQTQLFEQVDSINEEIQEGQTSVGKLNDEIAEVQGQVGLVHRTMENVSEIQATQDDIVLLLADIVGGAA